MLFNARPLDLGIAPEGEDVVAEDVLLAVVLVEASMRRAIDEVVLGQDVCGAFVEIDAPAAILKGRHVVEAVEADDRAFLVAQSIDAAHVAENRRFVIGFHADVMDMVVLHDVPLGRRPAIAPGPADGNTGVPEAVNVVVGDRVVVRLADPQGYATGKQVAAVGDRAIGDLIAEGLFVFRVANGDFADFDAAGAQIGKRATDDAVVLAALRKLDAVVADVRQPRTSRKCRTARPFPTRHRARRLPPGRNRCASGSGLRLQLVACRISMRPAGRSSGGQSTTPCWKTRGPEGHVLDELAGGRIALQAQHLCQSGAITWAWFGSTPAGGIR